MEEAPKTQDEENNESRVENPTHIDKNVLKVEDGEVEEAMEKAEGLELESTDQEEARLAGIEDDSNNPLEKAA